MNTNIIYMPKNEYFKEQKDLFWNIKEDEVGEENYDLANPKFGEIWICSLPVLVVDNEHVYFKKQNRPILIIDDTSEHFVKDDNKNYYGLKITSQIDSYHRIAIENYHLLGLKKESYIRLELPLKIERVQCLYKISQIEESLMNKYLKIIESYVQKQV